MTPSRITAGRSSLRVARTGTPCACASVSAAGAPPSRPPPSLVTAVRRCYAPQIAYAVIVTVPPLDTVTTAVAVQAVPPALGAELDVVHGYIEARCNALRMSPSRWAR